MGTGIESEKTLRVARTELRIGLRRFAFWFMALIFAAIGGFFFTRFMSISSGEDSLTQGVKLARNAPYSLAVLMAFLALFFVHFTAALTVDPVLRDRRIGLLPLVLSSPIEGSGYVIGKFLGALALTLLAPLSFVLVAGIVQFVPNSSVGLVPPNATGLLVAYLEFYVPFVMTVAALAFSLAIWTGSAKFVYAVVTVFFITYMIMLSLVDVFEYRWVAILDPTGILFLDELSKGRTNEDLNALGWFLDRGFLLNRFILLAVGIGTLGAVARGFARREARASAIRQPALADQATARQPALADQATARQPAPRPTTAIRVLAPLRPLDPGIRLAVGELRQLGRVAATELRLLSHERSLFFLVPLLAFVLWISMTTSTGPFEAEPIPVSSQVARDAFWILVMFLFGTTIFFVGETAFREREEGLADLLHTYPVPESALLGGKVLSNLALSLILVGVGILTAIVYQLTHGGGPIDPKPFITMYGGILIPTIVILITISLCLSFVSGSKPGGYALVLGVGGALVWAFIRGHRHWLYNVPALNLFPYSDIVGLGPLRAAITLQRFYVLSLGFLFFWIAVALYPRRTASGGRLDHLRRTAARRRVLLPGLTSLAAALVLGGVIHARVENGMGSLASERLQVDYEKTFRAWLDGQHEPELVAVDLDLDLEPAQHAFTVRGEFLLRNSREVPIDSIHITVNPRLLAGGEMLLGGRPPDAFQVAVATYRLPAPLTGGETIPLNFHWSGKVPDGVPRHNAALSTFITPGATFLHSFAPWPWLPVIGYNADVEIESERIRRKYDLPAKESLPLDDGSGLTRGLAYLSAPFPYRARIRIPDGEQVLSAGNLVAEHELGDGRREYEYVSDGGIYFYPLLAGRWAERRDGPSAVYHAPVHPQNAEKILDALVRSRDTYSELFSPFPYQELRVAEFPRLTGSAMGYPTLIPFSEGIGFLTRDREDRVNLNFYVTAHEVAHQWWGTVVWPAHAKGSPVLTEGLANYSTLLMAERFEGNERRQKLFEDMEDRYLRERDANEERPLAVVDGDRRGDRVLLYDRGGIVFYMLHRVLGEERMLAGIREYVDRFSFQNDHPTMTDFMAIFEELYPESARFLDQFVRDKAIPNPRYREVAKKDLGDGAWQVDFELANEGSGDLDLVVAATSGEQGSENWKEARTVVALRGTAPAVGTIYCNFEPESILMDPDRVVLLQERRRGHTEL